MGLLLQKIREPGNTFFSPGIESSGSGSFAWNTTGSTGSAWNSSTQPIEVPEPSSMSILVIGVLLFVVLRKMVALSFADDSPVEGDGFETTQPVDPATRATAWPTRMNLRRRCRTGNPKEPFSGYPASFPHHRRATPRGCRATSNSFGERCAGRVLARAAGALDCPGGAHNADPGVVRARAEPEVRIHLPPALSHVRTRLPRSAGWLRPPYRCPQLYRREVAGRRRRPGAHPIDDLDPRGFHRRRCPRFEPQAKKVPPAAGLESLFAARETDGSKRRQ